MLSFLSESDIIRKIGVRSIQRIKASLEDYVLSHNELRNKLLNQKFNIKIDPEYSEKMIAECLEGQYVGGGNSPTDVIATSEDDNIKIAIDVKCLRSSRNKCINTGTDTSFCSLMTSVNPLYESGNKILNLGYYTKSSKLNGIIKKLHNKYSSIESKFNVKELYYMFILTSNHNIGISMAKINYHKSNRYDLVTVNNKVKQKIDITKRRKGNDNISMSLDGILESDFGKTKLNSDWKNLQIKLFPKSLPKIMLWNVNIIQNNYIQNNINSYSLTQIQNNFKISFEGLSNSNIFVNIPDKNTLSPFPNFINMPQQQQIFTIKDSDSDSDSDYMEIEN